MTYLLFLLCFSLSGCWSSFLFVLVSRWDSPILQFDQGRGLCGRWEPAFCMTDALNRGSIVLEMFFLHCFLFFWAYLWNQMQNQRKCRVKSRMKNNVWVFGFYDLCRLTVTNEALKIWRSREIEMSKNSNQGCWFHFSHNPLCSCHPLLCHTAHPKIHYYKPSVLSDWGSFVWNWCFFTPSTMAARLRSCSGGRFTTRSSRSSRPTRR